MFGEAFTAIVFWAFIGGLVGESDNRDSNKNPKLLYICMAIFITLNLLLMGKLTLSLFAGITGLILGFDKLKLLHESPILYCTAFVLLAILVGIYDGVEERFGSSALFWNFIFPNIPLIFIWILPIVLVFSIVNYFSNEIFNKDLLVENIFLIFIIAYLAIFIWKANERYNNLSNLKENQMRSYSHLNEKDVLDCSNVKHYCTQMVTCSEAKLAYQCGNHNLDRDNDGIPCDNLCQ
jgi:hypothetical protein